MFASTPVEQVCVNIFYISKNYTTWRVNATITATSFIIFLSFPRVVLLQETVTNEPFPLLVMGVRLNSYMESLILFLSLLMVVIDNLLLWRFTFVEVNLSSKTWWGMLYIVVYVDVLRLCRAFPQLVILIYKPKLVVQLFQHNHPPFLQWILLDLYTALSSILKNCSAVVDRSFALKILDKLQSSGTVMKM